MPTIRAAIDIAAPAERAWQILCDLDGTVLEGDLKPSSDTAAHAYVYREMPEVGGVVHTHSTYASAWAARGEPVPCVLTAMADEFGGEIPVGPFALIGDDSIGQGIVATLDGKSSLGRLGLVVHQTAGVIDAGFDGHITLELANMANLPITVYPGMRIAQLSFMTLTTPADHPYGSGTLGSKYQGQAEPTPSRYHLNFQSPR